MEISEETKKELKISLCGERDLIFKGNVGCIEFYHYDDNDIEITIEGSMRQEFILTEAQVFLLSQWIMETKKNNKWQK